MSVRISVNGFGRIGRNVVRGIFEDQAKYKSVEVVSINDLTDAKTLAHLFKYDSVFGIFNGTVEHDDSSITVNGKKINVFVSLLQHQLKVHTPQHRLALLGNGLHLMEHRVINTVL